MGGVGRHGSREPGGGHLRLLRHLGVDHGDDLVVELRERPVERDLVLAPGQGTREQRIGVGGDAQAVRGQEERPRPQQQAGKDDDGGTADRMVDDGGKEILDGHSRLHPLAHRPAGGQGVVNSRRGIVCPRARVQVRAGRSGRLAQQDTPR